MLNIDDIAENVKAKPKEEVKTVQINLMDSLTLNIDMFLNRFKEIDNMNDNELHDLVEATYAMVLESTVAKKDTMLAITLFNNIRYVTALINVLSKVSLTYSQRVYCNKLVYDYLRVPENKNPTIEQLLQNLSNTVNADIIPGLLGIGLPRDLASYIALARYSSMDEHTTVKRVNRCIFNTGDTNLITEVRLIRIYENLYSDCMTKLFKGIMLDVYPKDYLNECSEESNEIYSLIGLAVLTMVNTMPYDSIRFILKSYHTDYINFPSYVRFSLKLSDDYHRINDVIFNLQENGIYLP